MSRSERSLMASLLDGRIGLDEILDVLPSHDREVPVFVGSEELAVWSAVQSARKNGFDINRTTVSAYSRGVNLDDFYAEGDPHESLELCRQALIRRRARKSLDGLMWALDDGVDEPVEKVLGNIAGAISSLTSSQGSDSWSSLGDIQDEEEQVYGLGDTMIPTGIREIDEEVRGVTNGNLVTVMAGTSTGKSVMLLDIAVNVALMQGKPVLMYGLEMRKKDYLHRLWARLSGRPLVDVRSGYMTGEEIRDVREKVKSIPLYIDDRTGVTAEMIAARSRSFAAMHPGTSLVVVDYLQRITASGGKNDNDESRTAAKAKTLKDLALTIERPVITASQVTEKSWANRPKAERRPVLSDGKYANAIAEESDMVIGLGRDESGGREFAILKHRQGSTSSYAPIKSCGATATFCPEGPWRG